MCLTLLFGCTGSISPDPKTAESVIKKRDRARMIVDASTGEAIKHHELIGAISTKRVIYVAERHDNVLDHAAQYGILRDLFRADPSLMIGFEMFQTPFQETLDEWTGGLLDEAALRRGTEYDSRWGHDFSFYRPMLEFARKWSIPLLALNATREITSKIAAGGMVALSSQERADLPELELDDAAHRALFDQSFDVDAHGRPEDSHRFYMAQVVWDETMAASIARAFDVPGARSRMVVFAGRVHIAGGLGIPKRAARRGIEPFVTVMPVDKRELDEELDRPVEARSADYFWVNPAD